MLPLTKLAKYISNNQCINTLPTRDFAYTKSNYRYYDYDTIYDFFIDIGNDTYDVSMNTNIYKAHIAVQSIFMEFSITKSNKLRFKYARDQRNNDYWVYLYPNMQKVSLMKTIKIGTCKYDLRLIYINGKIKTVVISPMLTAGNHKQVSTITLEYNANRRIQQIEIQYCGRHDVLLYRR